MGRSTDPGVPIFRPIQLYPGEASYLVAVVEGQKVMLAQRQTELEDTQAANDITLAVRAERELDLEELIVDLTAQVARLKNTIATATEMVDVWHTRAVKAEEQLRQLRGFRESCE